MALLSAMFAYYAAVMRKYIANLSFFLFGFVFVIWPLIPVLLSWSPVTFETTVVRLLSYYCELWAAFVVIAVFHYRKQCKDKRNGIS